MKGEVTMKLAQKYYRRRQTLPFTPAEKITAIASIKLRGESPDAVIGVLYDRYGLTRPMHGGQVLSTFLTWLDRSIRAGDRGVTDLARSAGIEIEDDGNNESGNVR